MIEKERLLGIADLKLAGIIESMDDPQLQHYDQELTSYIEHFPDSERKIKAALEAKDYAALVTNLSALCDMLKKIHADEIAAGCKIQISEIKDIEHKNHEKIEAYVTYFLGSTATLSIDIQIAKYVEKKAEKKEEKKMDDKPAKSASEKTILAVDDASISLNMLKKQLQEFPYQLTCVNSGEEALRYLKTHQPDLFILDIEMPKMNGYELAERIREYGQKAPIIFLTGNATRKYLVKAIQAGASDFIVKPLDKKYLLYKINKHMP
jgi:CheY-like chemotaxis protein